MVQFKNLRDAVNKIEAALNNMPAENAMKAINRSQNSIAAALITSLQEDLFVLTNPPETIFEEWMKEVNGGKTLDQILADLKKDSE